MEDKQDKRYLREQEVARLYSISVFTLRNWRHACKGPAYSKAGRAVRYSMAEVERFFSENTVRPYGEARK